MEKCIGVTPVQCDDKNLFKELNQIIGKQNEKKI